MIKFVFRAYLRPAHGQKLLIALGCAKCGHDDATVDLEPESVQFSASFHSGPPNDQQPSKPAPPSSPSESTDQGHI